MDRLKVALLATTAIVAAPQAQADPISAAVASMAAATFSAGGLSAAGFTAFTGFGLSLTGAGAVFAHLAVRSALGYALNALTDRAQSRTSASSGYRVNSLGASLPRSVIYGRVRVGGVVFYQATTGTNNRYLHRCVALAGHEVSEIEDIYLNDQKLTLDGSGDVTAPAEYVGFVRIKAFTGTAAQAAATDLVGEVTEWTAAHQAKGVAYLYARYDFSASVFPNGVPSLTATIKGRQVYDPRDGSTAWSDNPALILRDYLTASFGLSETSSEIDDTLFAVAANVCDEYIDGLATYTCNGTFTLDAAPGEVIKTIISSMGGLFWYAGGKWGCKAASYTSPVKDFTEDDLRGQMKIATRHSRRSNFNTVKGTYIGEETNWQDSDFEPVTDAAFVTEDDGETVNTDLPLPFTNTSIRARRIAEIALRRNREQLTVSCPLGLRALDVRIGDNVRMTIARMGWTNKEFEVVDWRFGLTSEMDLQINVMLREINSTVFD